MFDCTDDFVHETILSNGNKEHFFLSSMMLYTFIGIHVPYSSIHLYGGYEEAQLHTCTKFMPEILPWTKVASIRTVRYLYTYKTVPRCV